MLEMAPAFGVRRFGAALVVILGSTDFRDEGRSEPIFTAIESKSITKAVPSDRTPKAVAELRVEFKPIASISREPL
jgi:hypothetical protein